MIMKLKKKSKKGKPACVPGPGMQDTTGQEKLVATLAGYGQYTRESCQTDSYGPMKYHYCQMNEDNEIEFQDGQTAAKHTGCVTKQLTPAKWSRLCSKPVYYIPSRILSLVTTTAFRFLSENEYGDFEDGLDGVEEVHLVRKKDGEVRYLETCYRQDAKNVPGQHGWCRYQSVL